MRVPVTEMGNHEEERLWEGAESCKENSINVCMKPLNESILFIVFQFPIGHLSRPAKIGTPPLRGQDYISVNFLFQ